MAFSAKEINRLHASRPNHGRRLNRALSIGEVIQLTDATGILPFVRLLTGCTHLVLYRRFSSVTVRVSRHRHRIIWAVADLFDAMTIAGAVERGCLTPRDAKALIIDPLAGRGSEEAEADILGGKGVAA